MSRTKKKKNGQTGADGNEYLRKRRIETRVSDAEQEAIKAAAASAGCLTVGQFLRDRALYAPGESPSTQAVAFPAPTIAISTPVEAPAASAI